jgi:hypothetical protein
VPIRDQIIGGNGEMSSSITLKTVFQPMADQSADVIVAYYDESGIGCFAFKNIIA